MLSIISLSRQRMARNPPTGFGLPERRPFLGLAVSCPMSTGGLRAGTGNVDAPQIVQNTRCSFSSAAQPKAGRLFVIRNPDVSAAGNMRAKRTCFPTQGSNMRQLLMSTVLTEPSQ